MSDTGTTSPNALGRGGSILTFFEDEVFKTPASLMEPLIIKAFPRTFIPIKRVVPSHDGTFVMPRMLPSTVEHRRTALMAGLDKLMLLWQHPMDRLTCINWRGKLYRHISDLRERYPRFIPKNAALLVQDLREPPKHVHIHGDSTLANLVHNEHDEWFWIDPLHRDFIPGDPHVDLGKMFQSCTGYEQVLLGDTPSPDRALMKQLARRANLDMGLALRWQTIHIIRLIPYQEERVQEHYAEVLRRLM